MNIIAVNLFKRVDTLKNSEDAKNLFTTIGYFDRMQFEVIGNEKISKDGFVLPNIPDKGHGYYDQSLYLFDAGSLYNQDELNNYVSAEFKDECGLLPFCVMVLLEDNIDAINDQQFDNKGDIYEAQFQKFIMERKTNRRRMDMKIFDTLSCADTVLLFRSSSVSLIHQFILHLANEKIVLTSYSIYGILSGFSFANAKKEKILIDDDKDLQLSVRIRFNSDYFGTSYPLLEKLLKQKGNVEYTKTTLAGNYHTLYTFSHNIYSILDQILYRKGILSMSNPKTHPYIATCRPTLRFEAEDMDSQYIPQIPKHKQDQTLQLLNQAYLQMQEQWEKIVVSNSGNTEFKQLAIYGKTVAKILQQWIQLFEQLNRQKQQKINPELFSILKPTLVLLTDTIQTHTGEMSELAKSLGNELFSVQNTFLEQVQYTLNDLGMHVEEILHMQRNCIQNRGHYQSEVSKAAKLAIGYHEYANHLGELLHATSIKDETSFKQNPYSFYINFLAMNNKVTATERFYIQRQMHQNAGRIDKSILIKIAVSQQSVYNIHQVRAAITHEVAHFIGWRDRPCRAKHIVRTVCRWVVLQLVPPFGIPDESRSHKKTKTENDFEKKFADCREQINAIRDKACKELENQLYDKMIAVLQKCYGDDLQWTYLQSLEKILVRILQHWLGRPDDTRAEEQAEIINSYIDLPVKAVNLNMKIRKESSETILKYLDSFDDDKDYKQTEIYNWLINCVSSEYEMLNDTVRMTARRVEKMLNTRLVLPDALAFTEFDRESHSLKERTMGASVVKIPPDNPLLSLQEFAAGICNAYSEVFCDVLMIRLMGISPETYYEYTNIGNNVEYYDKFRLNTVLRYAFDEKSLPENVQILFDAFQKDNYLLQACGDEIIDYLNAVFESPTMKNFFDEHKAEFYSRNQKEEGQETEFDYIFSYYQKLHRREMSKVKGSNDQ